MVTKATALGKLQKRTDMLRVLQIQGSVHLVENVHGRWLELEQRHDERQCNQRPLPTRKLSQTLLPDLPQPHFHFKALCDVHVFRRLKLAKVARQQVSKDGTEVPFKSHVLSTLSKIRQQANNELTHSLSAKSSATLLSCGQ